MAQAFLAVVRRDLRIAFRRLSDLASPLMFFAIVITLFPLAISPEPAVLREIGPGVLWVAALLATLLALNTLFRSDFDDGSLEQLALSAHPLPLLVFGKILAHWLISGVPLVLLSPLLALSYDLSSNALQVLTLALLIGTPTLSLLGSVGAALTAGVRQAGGLLALLVLPLMLPVLVFGARATTLAAAEQEPAGPLYLLAALAALAVTLGPFATAAAVRVSLE
ncbi:MAG: heme exporter protein CcmB [Gammaproteobacteria bacterium]|nr:heme exporter protein CcmB [Gammaproteobacteria bacterium]